MPLLYVLLLVLSGIGTWLGIVLLERAKVKHCNRYMAFIVLMGAGYLLSSTISVNQLWIDTPYLLFLPVYLTFIFGPSVFLYTKYLIRDDERIKPLELLHFIPFVAQLIFHTYWFLQPYDVKLEYYHTYYKGTVRLIEVLYVFFSVFIYAVIAYLTTTRYVEHNFQAITKESRQILRYSKYVNVMFIISALALLIYALLIYTTGYQLPRMAFYPYYIYVLYMTTYIAYSITKYPSITLEKLSLIRSSKRDEDFERKLESIAVPRMFDPELGPYPNDELSELLEINPNYLSTYLKIHYKTNYPGFVRDRRMEEFERLVQEAKGKGEEILVSELQEKCGYRNRGSFNRDVKETFGVSPSAYLEQLHS